MNVPIPQGNPEAEAQMCYGFLWLIWILAYPWYRRAAFWILSRVWPEGEK